MSKLSDWWLKWFGPGTADDRRNPFWRFFEGPARINVSWAWTILDLRIGYRRIEGKWVLIDLFAPYRTRQNFWNGVFTIQVYIVGWKWFMWPKLNIVFRPLRDWWFEGSTLGILFDSGVIHAKFVIFNWQKEQGVGQGGDAIGWEEGSV